MHLSHFQTGRIGPVTIISLLCTDLPTSYSACTPDDSVSSHHQWIKRPPQVFPPPCWLVCDCRTVLQWWVFPWFKNIIIENFHVISVIFIQLGPVIPHAVPLVVSHAVISCSNSARGALRISWLVALHALISFQNRAHRPSHCHFFHKYRAANILLWPYSRWFCIRSPPVGEAAPSTGAQAFPQPCWLLCECRTILQWWAFPWFKNIIIEHFHVITVIFIQLRPVITHVVPLVVSHAVITCPNRAHRTLSISWLVVLHAIISFQNRAHRPSHSHFFHN